MAGNDEFDGQASQHLQSIARGLQAVSGAEQFGKNDAKAIFPKRIAGNQQALFRVVVGQRVHVVPGHCQALPV